MTAHDGFTLNDLVSYNEKHNDGQRGGQPGRGEPQPVLELRRRGAHRDGEVDVLRERQKRNFLTTLLLSQGVPMIAHGDELGRTQQGNNNVYCQDNELSWIDWDDAREHEVLTEFTARLAALRREHPVFRRQRFFQGRPIHGSSIDDIAWLRPDGQHMTDGTGAPARPAPSRSTSTATASRTATSSASTIVDDSFLLLINAHHQQVTFTLPDESYGRTWEVVIDTADPLLASTRRRPPVAGRPAAGPGPGDAGPAVPVLT